MPQSNNKAKELILSIDAGTQSIRAALIDLNGNILHIVVVRFVLCGEPFACFQGIGGIVDGFGCGLRHHRDVIVIPPWFGRRRVR